MFIDQTSIPLGMGEMRIVYCSVAAALSAVRRHDLGISVISYALIDRESPIIPSQTSDIKKLGLLCTFSYSATAFGGRSLYSP
jgi:hypothetical protein